MLIVFEEIHLKVLSKQRATVSFESKVNVNKVNRCLARYSPRATTTSKPINRALNEPAMVRNAKFGPNLVVSGQKILFLLEKSKVLLLT